MEHHPEDMKAAEEYLQAHGRTGGSSLATIDAFLAGCQHVRTSAEWKAMELVVRKAIGVSGAYEADIYTPAAMSDLDNALAELDRIRKEGESG